MSVKPFCVLLNSLALIMGLPAMAQAQQTAGRVRVSLEGVLAHRESIAMSATSPQESPTTSPIEAHVKTGGIGLFTSGAALGLGVGLGESVVLGAQFGYSKETREVEEFPQAHAETHVLSLLPQLEYGFSTGTALRPFVFVSGGLRSGKSTQAGRTTASFSQGVFGAGAGAHIFATDSFSIDPSLSVYAVSSSETIAGADFTGAGTSVVLAVAFSGWLGESSEKLESTPHRGGADPALPTRAHVRGSDASPSAAPVLAEKDRVQIRRNVVSVRITLPNKAEMRLLGQPKVSSDKVVVHLAGYNAPSLLNCDSVKIGHGDEAEELGELRHGALSVGSGIPTLQGTTSVETLDKLFGAAKNASLEACEERWTLGSNHLERVGKFLEVFRRVTQSVSAESTP